MNAAELYVEEHAGTPDAPVVVLVHGVFDSCQSFEGVIDHLLPDHSVVTYDAGAVGLAPPMPRRVPSLDDHADDLLSVVGDRMRALWWGTASGGTVSYLAAVRARGGSAALGLFEPSMQWQPWWPSMDVIAAESVYEQEHFRAGLEGKPRRTREEREREQALLAHELTLIAEAPCTPDQLTVPRLVGRGMLSASWRFGTTDHQRDEFDCELIEIEDAGHTAHRMQPKGFADFTRRGTGRMLGSDAR